MARRIKSALFHDHENVALKPEEMARFVAWLEDGLFDEGKRRRILTRRVYWNPTAERYRDAYNDLGFEVILCERLAGLKNGADIRMAMDVIEEMRKSSIIQEVILVTRDTDFIPVLQRIDDYGLNSVVLVKEEQPKAYFAYKQHADVIIPDRLLPAAMAYQPPPRGLVSRIVNRLRWRRSKPKQSTVAEAAKKAGDGAAAGAGVPVAAAAQPVAVPTPVSARPAQQPAVPKQQAPRAPAAAPIPPAASGANAEVLEQALDKTIKVTSRTPKRFTAARAIERELGTLRGFQTRGKSAYFGYGTYRNLMKTLATRDKRLRVTEQAQNGTSVMYWPNEDA